MKNVSRAAQVVGVLITVLLVAAPAAADEPLKPPPSFDYQAEVVETFENSAGDPVVLRRGWWYEERPNKGFGFDKIFHKHGITNTAVIASLLKHPESVRELGPGRYNHVKTAKFISCSFEYGCLTLKEVSVILAVSYHDFYGYGQFGVVTAYCDGYPYPEKCPSWINSSTEYGLRELGYLTAS